MVELIVIAGILLWCAAAFVNTGAGSRSAQRMAVRITRMVSGICAILGEMDYAVRRQQELLLEWDSDRAHVPTPVAGPSHGTDEEPHQTDERPLA